MILYHYQFSGAFSGRSYLDTVLSYHSFWFNQVHLCETWHARTSTERCFCQTSISSVLFFMTVKLVQTCSGFLCYL